MWSVTIHVEHPKLWEQVFAPNQTAFTLSPDEFLDSIDATFSSSLAYKEREVDVFTDVTISDLVKWMTGSKFIPVLGFPKTCFLLYMAAELNADVAPPHQYAIFF